MIFFKCSSCERWLQAPDERAGARVRCGACGAVVIAVGEREAPPVALLAPRPSAPPSGENVEEAPLAERVEHAPSDSPPAADAWRGLPGTTGGQGHLRRFLERRILLVPGWIAGGMLAAALLKWPYGYYTLLRLVVCLVGGAVAGIAWVRKLYPVAFLFGFIALLFNPLVPVHMKRETWRVVDMVAGALFIAVGFIRTNTDR